MCSGALLGSSDERPRTSLEPHAGQAVETHLLDQSRDLRLRPHEQDVAAVGAQTAGQRREIQHQRGVGEDQFAEVDRHVGLAQQRAHHRAPPVPLGRAVLPSATAQRRRLFIEINDGAETYINRRCTSKPELRSRASPSSLTAYTECMVTVEDVTDVLRDVIDPELGLDFVELGLIYDVEIEGGTVRILYTLTSPGCPIGPQVSEQIMEFVAELDGVTDVQPTMTFSPPWTPDRMSEDAKFALGF